MKNELCDIRGMPAMLQKKNCDPTWRKAAMGTWPWFRARPIPRYMLCCGTGMGRLGICGIGWTGLGSVGWIACGVGLTSGLVSYNSTETHYGVQEVSKVEGSTPLRCLELQVSTFLASSPDINKSNLIQTPPCTNKTFPHLSATEQVR